MSDRERRIPWLLVTASGILFGGGLGALFIQPPAPNPVEPEDVRLVIMPGRPEARLPVDREAWVAFRALENERGEFDAARVMGERLLLTPQGTKVRVEEQTPQRANVTILNGPHAGAKAVVGWRYLIEP